MARVLGVGGMFFKSANPDRLNQWYGGYVGVMKKDEPGVSFPNAEQPQAGFVVWSAFDADTTYFEPGDKQYMFNQVVDDLESALRPVEKGGAKIVGDIEAYAFGSFGWFIDPGGNKIELWQPRTPEQESNE